VSAILSATLSSIRAAWQPLSPVSAGPVSKHLAKSGRTGLARLAARIGLCRARIIERLSRSHDEHLAKTRVSRFNTVTTVLIAHRLDCIALVASQSAVAQRQPTEAQHDGVLAKINLERSRWAQARAQLAQSSAPSKRTAPPRPITVTFDYITKAENPGNKALGTRLRLEAAAQLKTATTPSTHLTRATGYWRDGQYTGWTTQTFLNDRRQGAATFEISTSPTTSPSPTHGG